MRAPDEPIVGGNEYHFKHKRHVIWNLVQPRLNPCDEWCVWIWKERVHLCACERRLHLHVRMCTGSASRACVYVVNTQCTHTVQCIKSVGHWKRTNQYVWIFWGHMYKLKGYGCTHTVQCIKSVGVCSTHTVYTHSAVYQERGSLEAHKSICLDILRPHV